MLKFLATALDRGIIRMASVGCAGGTPWVPDSSPAQPGLGDLDFSCSFKAGAPELVFHGAHDFEFTSSIRTPWPRNNRVRGKLFRAGGDWKSRPSVVLLHGWSADLQYQWQFPLLARRLARVGINAVIFELPYHGQRRPREEGAPQNFISHDLNHMLEATQQSVADTCGMLAWLKSQGSPTVGVWGVSLGAWLAGLLISTRCPPEPPLETTSGADFQPSDFAVLLTPVVEIDQAIAKLPFCAAIRRSLESTPLSVRPFNLSSRVLLLPKNNLLLVESQYDVFAPAETIESLWQAWGEPQIWRLPHGHISILLSPLLLNRIIGWIRLVTGRDTPH